MSYRIPKKIYNQLRKGYEEDIFQQELERARQLAKYITKRYEKKVALQPWRQQE